MDIETYSTLLKRYRKNKFKLLKLKDQIEKTQYYINGVRGVSFDGIPGEPQGNQDSKFLEMIEKMDELKREKQKIQSEICYVNAITARLNQTVQYFIIEKYFIGRNWVDIANELGMSDRGLRKIVAEEIERKLKKI